MATAADVEAMLQAWLPELQSASKSVQAKVDALKKVRENLDGAKAERESWKRQQPTRRRRQNPPQ